SLNDTVSQFTSMDYASKELSRQSEYMSLCEQVKA
ncbi:hypothetical protein Tco_1450618, partial [Tanacetum coccineum]